MVAARLRCWDGNSGCCRGEEAPLDVAEAALDAGRAEISPSFARLTLLTGGATVLAVVALGRIDLSRLVSSSN